MASMSLRAAPDRSSSVLRECFLGTVVYYVYVYTIIYIYIERERDRERERVMCIYIYIYIHTYIYVTVEQPQLSESSAATDCNVQPVYVRRFTSFRTQPLENLSHYL